MNSVLETCLPMTSDGAAAREAAGGGTGRVAAQGRETAPVGETTKLKDCLQVSTEGRILGRQRGTRPEDYRGGGCTLRPPEMQARRLGQELPGKGSRKREQATFRGRAQGIGSDRRREVG